MERNTSKFYKELKILTLVIIIGILAIGMSIFISKALYEYNGQEVEAKAQSSLNLIKYVNYEDNGQEKSILEFNLKEKVTYNNEYYSPVKENSVYVKIPEIAGQLPESIDVISISSKATNGNDEQKEAQYEYNAESKILHIYDNNEVDENGEIYYGNGNDYDEYEIIFHYDKKIELSDEESAAITIPVLIRYESINEEIGRVQEIFNNEIILREKGNIISTEIKTQDIYNGYINSNIANGTEYETEFLQETTIYVSELNTDEIVLKEQNGFRTIDNEVKHSNDIIYKQIKINKQDILRVLGEDGYLQILDDKENILLEINKDYNIEENEIVFNFENENSGLILKTSKPINKGLIRIQTTNKLDANMKDIDNKYVLTVQKIIGNKITESNEVTENETKTIIETTTIDETEIQKAITKVNVTLDNTDWTSNIQNNVNIIATLVTSKSECNLFKKPTIEIELPDVVEKVIIGDSYLLNANGLSLGNVNVIDKENGKKAIIANIQGSQTEYLFDNMIDGTNVVIPVTIILKKEFASYSDNVNVECNNEVGNDIEKVTSEIAVNLEAIIENRLEQNDKKDEDIQSNNNQVDVLASDNTSQVELLKQNNGLAIDIQAKVGEEIVSRVGTNEEQNVQNGKIYEEQVIKYTVTIKNNTDKTINDVSVIGSVPNYTKYGTVEYNTYWEKLKYNYIIDENLQQYKFENINSIEAGETVSGWYEVVVQDLEDNKLSESITSNFIIKIGEEEYSTYNLENELCQAELNVFLKSQINREGDDTFCYVLEIKNLNSTEINNIYCETSEMPKELKLDRYIDFDNTEGVNVRQEDKKIKIDIDKLNANQTLKITFCFIGTDYDENINQMELKMSAKAVANNITYQSNENRITAYPQYVTAIVTLDKEGEDVEIGEELNYTFTIKNESKVRTTININYNLPEKLEGEELTYSYYDLGEDIRNEYDIEKEQNIEYELIDGKFDLAGKVVDSETGEKPNDFNLYDSVIPAGKELIINVRTKAGFVTEKTEVANLFSVYGESIKTVTSNVVKVNILPENNNQNINDDDDETTEDNKDPSDENQEDNKEPDEENNDNSKEEDEKTEEDKENEDKEEIKYKITGNIWLDENEDGSRNENELPISGITVKLFNAETNAIVVINNNKAIIQTEKNGEYVFNNVPKGKYYCVFEYDVEKYNITTYQKSGINTSINNDASKTEVNIDGVKKIVGITDVLVVENRDLSNIDLGLVENKKFNLKLEKYISKVTVETSKGKKEYTYENKSLVKTEIASKYIKNAIVTIEYNLIVTNEGNIAGYVNEITDYVPDELEFIQSENSGWILNSNKSVKNTSLSANILNAGESKSVKLILRKKLDENSTGIIINNAKITKSSNYKNLKDIDSTEVNGEKNDYSSAQIIISLSTGVYKNTMLILICFIAVYITIKIIKKYKIKPNKVLICLFALGIVLSNSNISKAIEEGTETRTRYTSMTCTNPDGAQDTFIDSEGRYWRCASGSDYMWPDGQTYYYTETTRTYVSSRERVKNLGISIDNGSAKFKCLNASSDIVGPYKVTCKSDIKKSTITSSVGSICNASGGSFKWKSGSSCTFYVLVPKGTPKVASVSVTAVIEDAYKVNYKKSIKCGEATPVGGGNLQKAAPLFGTTIRDAGTDYEDAEVSASAGPVYAGSLKILKKDASTGASIEASSGARFSVADSHGHVVATGVQIGQKVSGLAPDTYTVTETTAPEGYRLDLQENTVKTVAVTANSTAKITFKNQKYTNIEIKKVDSDTQEAVEGMGFTIYDNHYQKYISASGEQTNSPTTLYTDSNGLIRVQNIKLYDENTTFTIKEVESKNLYYKTDTSITGTITGKSNATVTWSSITIENTKPYYLTIVKRDPDMPSESLTARFYVQYEDGTWLTQSGEYSGSASAITVSNSLEIPKIKRGVYHIYECETPVGYDITQQDGYGSNGWVDCGTIYVGVNGSGQQDNNVCRVTVSKDNKKYIRNINGYVWIDNRTGKLNNYDYLYGPGDTKLSGIKVSFITKNGTELKSTTTGADGSYEFTFFREVLYWDLQNYMIKFTYDSENYTVVPINLSTSNSNASRAIENHNWENDYLALGSGEATTIPNANSSGNSIAKYYNVTTYSVETINLGLMIKPKEEFSIIENLDYVQLKKGSYTFKYEYGKDAVVQDVPERQYIYDTVALQNSARTFTQKLYPSDIAYNNTVTSNKFEVYVVYNILITNTMNINMDDLYVEKSLNITSLTNTYNSNIYEIADSNWQSTETGKAKYNGTIEAIPSGRVANISIQFKVTETGLQELIQGSKSNPEVYKDCATTAIADGYHKYDRNDYSWKYSPNSYKQKNEHRTKGETRESSALTLRLKLAEQRTISGSVFEDTRTSESEENNTRLGNGIYDADENNLKAVTVSLLNKDETVASLYSTKGEYLKQNADGIWTFNKQEATVEVNDDGTYTLEGVIPGEYYLRFTYSNGTQIVTDTSGNPINIINYKSTILTGAAANNSESNWHIDTMGGENSIATDKYYIDKDGDSSNIIDMRTTSDTEISYQTQNSFDEGKIQAFSAVMNIQFEYLKEQNKDYDYNFIPECSGMCFGIIERPHIEIELEKIISKVKLTLSNGTTIINGNPQDSNVSQYLTSMNESYAKVEMDNQYLYGSTVTITYKLTAINKSEIDYATEKYYKLGNIDDANKIVKTTLTKIIDYISDKNCNYVDSGENVTISNEAYNKEEYFYPEAIEANKEYKSQLLLTSKEELLPQKAGRGNFSADYIVTINKLLSNVDDNLGIESYSEIIGLKNVTFTAQYSNHSGNYYAADAVSFADGGTSEADNADSIIAITPSTGENRSYTIYIVAGAALIILASGIVIIKKFVI